MTEPFGIITQVNKFDIHPVSSIAWYNSGNSTSGATITMNTAGVASSTPTLCINTALTNITHATTGATGISDDGVAGCKWITRWSECLLVRNVITISGTPTASGTFNYTIPLSGGCGSVDATGTITVTADNTAGVASSTPTLCINTALTNITHATTGATGISNDGVAGANGLPGLDECLLGHQKCDYDIK